MQKSGVVWGNGLHHAGRFYFSGFRKALDVQICSGALFTINAVPKKMSKKTFRGTKKQINTILKVFIFCGHDYNSAVNTLCWAWSNFNSFVNFVWLMTNDDALKLSHQGEFVLCLLAGDRHTYKNNNLLQGKQTVSGFWSDCDWSWLERHEKRRVSKIPPESILPIMIFEEEKSGILSQTHTQVP